MTGAAYSTFPEAGAQRVEAASLGVPHLHDKWQGLGAGGGDRFVARVAVESMKATP